MRHRCRECAAPLCAENEHTDAMLCTECESTALAEYVRTAHDDRWAYASEGIDGGVYMEGGA